LRQAGHPAGRTVVVIYFVVNLIGAALLFVAALGGFLSGLHR
jgi:hypothetical protein